MHIASTNHSRFVPATGTSRHSTHATIQQLHGTARSRGETRRDQEVIQALRPTKTSIINQRRHGSKLSHAFDVTRSGLRILPNIDDSVHMSLPSHESSSHPVSVFAWFAIIMCDASSSGVTCDADAAWFVRMRTSHAPPHKSQAPPTLPPTRATNHHHRHRPPLRV